MRCNLYISTEDNDHTDKKALLIGTKEIQLKDGCGIVDPVIILKAKDFLPQTNYVGLPHFGRLYFVRDVVFDGNFVEISCHCDVLGSFYPAIKNSVFLVERQEFKSSPYLIDNELITRCDKRITQIPLGACGGVSGHYYLVVSGGAGV